MKLSVFRWIDFSTMIVLFVQVTWSELNKSRTQQHSLTVFTLKHKAIHALLQLCQHSYIYDHAQCCIISLVCFLKVILEVTYNGDDKPYSKWCSWSGELRRWPHTASPEGATLAAHRVQNPVQGGTGDVHNPHTPLPRLPHRFCAGVQQWSGTDSSPIGVQQRLHCSTDKNETWRQSLLCGRPSCMEQSTSEADSLHSFRRKLKTHLFTLCFNDWLTVLQTFVMHSRSGAE